MVANGPNRRVQNPVAGLRIRSPQKLPGTGPDTSVLNIDVNEQGTQSEFPFRQDPNDHPSDNNSVEFDDMTFGRNVAEQPAAKEVAVVVPGRSAPIAPQIATRIIVKGSRHDLRKRGQIGGSGDAISNGWHESPCVNEGCRVGLGQIRILEQMTNGYPSGIRKMHGLRASPSAVAIGPGAPEEIPSVDVTACRTLVGQRSPRMRAHRQPDRTRGAQTANMLIIGNGGR